MIQARSDADLAKKSLGGERLGKLRLEHLDCDVASVLEIMSEEDGRHRSRSELAVESITVGECGRERILVDHAANMARRTCLRQLLARQVRLPSTEQAMTLAAQA
jgi:hypothetical protein